MLLLTTGFGRGGAVASMMANRQSIDAAVTNPFNFFVSVEFQTSSSSIIEIETCSFRTKNSQLNVPSNHHG